MPGLEVFASVLEEPVSIRREIWWCSRRPLLQLGQVEKELVQRSVTEEGYNTTSILPTMT